SNSYRQQSRITLQRHLITLVDALMLKAVGTPPFESFNIVVLSSEESPNRNKYRRKMPSSGLGRPIARCADRDEVESLQLLNQTCSARRSLGSTEIAPGLCTAQRCAAFP